METLVALCASRGFIFPSSEVYGGINGFWDYGPLGVELKNNLKAAWWQRMVRQRTDVVGIDSAIISHPRAWEASGHVDHFSDPMVDCRTCKRRFRADQIDGERCPEAPRKRALGDCDLTEARDFNLMLQTQIGASVEAQVTAYLRPETCQPIFTDFKRVRESSRQKVPFGIAQIGKAFRNEITPRNFTFRSREFEQAEMEFFCHPSQREEWFEFWREERMRFHHDVGFDPENLRFRPHAPDELAHYANAAEDVDFLFPFGWQEIEGVHDRGDWDLSRHSEFSGKDLIVTDEETKERYTPMVIETSMGVDRTCLALLVNAYTEEEIEGGETRNDAALTGDRAGESRRPAPFEEALGARASPACGPGPDHERVLRRCRQYRPALSATGRGRHAFLCDLRLRFPGRREGHGARAGHHGAGANLHRGCRGLRA